MDMTRLRIAGGDGGDQVVEFADRWQLVAEAVVYVGRRMAVLVEGVGWSVSRTPGGDLSIVVQGVDLPPPAR